MLDENGEPVAPEMPDPTCPTCRNGKLHLASGFTITALRDLAFNLLLKEGEWHTEFPSGTWAWHDLICMTCGASFANTVPSNPTVKHKDGCQRARFFEQARKLGLIKKDH